MVVARWRPLYPGWRCDAELVLRACHMRVDERAPQPGAMQGVEMGDLFRWARPVWVGFQMKYPASESGIASKCCKRKRCYHTVTAPSGWYVPLIGL